MSINTEKIKSIVGLTIIITIIITIPIYKEYKYETRKHRAMEYYDKVMLLVNLADALVADLECRDSKGNVRILKAGENRIYTVNNDIIEYMQKKINYLYEYSIIEDNSTKRKIKNFNNNMENIRISGKDGIGNQIPPKTISEGEGLDEFKYCTNIDELTAYMYKLNKYGEYNLFALSIIGLDGTGYNGKIIYIMDNGEEKVLREDGVLYLGDLFVDNSK